MTMRALKSFDRHDLHKALKRGSFTLQLGPFSHLISGSSPALLDFLQDTYRDYSVEMSPSDVTEVLLNIRAPNLFRRFIRPQVTPDPGFDVPAVPLPRRMAPLAYEMGMNLSIALKCCRFVNIHAGVVADDHGAILMSAASGSGKSTLTAAMMQYGYRLFSDEFALLGLDEPLVHPYPRPISLKQETIPIVRELVGADWLSKTVSGTPKGDIAYYRARPEDLAKAHVPAPVKLILFPKFETGANPFAQRLNPAEAIIRLVPASTNYSLLGEEAYKTLASLVENASAFELTYGTTEQSIDLVKQLTASH